MTLLFFFFKVRFSCVFIVIEYANVCHFYSNESVIIEKLARSLLLQYIHCAYHL